MTDILVRLEGYNPPDRTLDDQRQIAIDIHEAAAEIKKLRTWNANAGEIHHAMRTENDQLRAALKDALPLLDNSESPGGCDGTDHHCDHCGVIRTVRAAIGDQHKRNRRKAND